MYLWHTRWRYLQVSITFSRLFQRLVGVMSEEHRRLVECGKRFLSLQQERVLQHTRLSEKHKVYLRSAPNPDFEAFKAVVAEVTSSFQSLSQDILHLLRNDVAALRSGRSLAEPIEKVQDLEQKKLRVVVELQLLLEDQIQRSEETDSRCERERDLRELRRVLNAINEEVSEATEEVRCLVYDLSG